jgi:hypothetical protein
MKPKEFDDLVRQKFDQNDFEYNPGNWAKLEEAMDGRGKKRTAFLLWWVPLLGIAATVALSIGMVPALHMEGGKFGQNQVVAKNTESLPAHRTTGSLNNDQNSASNGNTANAHNAVVAMAHKSKHGKHNKKKAGAKSNSDDLFAITYANAVANVRAPKSKAQPFNFLAEAGKEQLKKEKKELREVVVAATFAPEEMAAPKQPRNSIILSGGYNIGTTTTGVMAGATIRHMVTGKVYIETDVAVAANNNTGTQSYSYYQTAKSTQSGTGMAARGSKVATDGIPDLKPAPPTLVKGVRDLNYNLSFVQVSPSIGVKLKDKITMGVGPDFQQIITDNRPAIAASSTRDNIQTMPSFDIGVTGKTEYSITKNLKAGVSYRKGINNVLTLMDKYIDRDYVQFQVKCTILNK